MYIFMCVSFKYLSMPESPAPACVVRLHPPACTLGLGRRNTGFSFAVRGTCRSASLWFAFCRELSRDFVCSKAQ